jgi:hypothetical protein
MTPQPESTKPRRGCLFYGSIAAIVCLVAMLLAVLLGLHMVRKVVNQYTDTKPATVPALALTAEQINQVQHRVDQFQDALGSGRPTAPLELNSDDLNAIIASRVDFQGLKDKVYLKVEGDKITAQVSLPMEQLGLRIFKGRYLNGEITFSVSVVNGRLRISPSMVTVKGKPLPETYLEKLRGENFASGINDSPKASVALNRLEKVEVKDGKVILIPKEEK